MRSPFKFKFKSLTMRIWITFVIFVVAIVLGISVIYLTIVRNMYKANQVENLQVAHDTICQFLTQRDYFSHTEPPKFDFNDRRPISHLIIKVDDSNNITLNSLDKRFEDDAAHLKPLAEWFLTYIQNNTFNKQYFEGKFDTHIYIFEISPIVLVHNDPAYLVSYSDYVARNDLIYLVITIGAVFIIVALIVSKIVSNYISKPLKKLEAQAIKIAHKEWMSPLITSSEDEIGSLIKSINYMQDALKKADQEERTFLQSISHDLKTPIMVIRSHAEAIKDGIYIDSLENTAAIIESEAERLQSKVSQILYYNTLDYVLTNAQHNTEMDLKRLLNFMIKKFSPLKPELEWQVSLKPVIIYASSEHLQVAIENILDNQLRYAESFVRIVLRRDEHSAIIHISNNGPHISPDVLPHIFSHLYRGENGKFGLGLAITQKIITFYGGLITVENTNKGVIFKIKIPLNH